MWLEVNHLSNIYIIQHLVPICLAFGASPPSCIQELRYFLKADNSPIYILGVEHLKISYIPIKFFANDVPSVLIFTVRDGRIKCRFKLSIKASVKKKLSTIEGAIKECLQKAKEKKQEKQLSLLSTKA